MNLLLPKILACRICHHQVGADKMFSFSEPMNGSVGVLIGDPKTGLTVGQNCEKCGTSHVLDAHDRELMQFYISEFQRARWVGENPFICGCGEGSKMKLHAGDLGHKYLPHGELDESEPTHQSLICETCGAGHIF